MATHRSASSPTSTHSDRNFRHTWLQFGQETIYTWSEFCNILGTVPLMAYNVFTAISFYRYRYESLETTSNFDRGKLIVGLMCAVWGPLKVYYAVDIFLVLKRREKQKQKQNHDEKDVERTKKGEEKDDEKGGGKVGRMGGE